MRKPWVLWGALGLTVILAGTAVLYVEGDQFDRAVDGRTRTIAPGVTVTSQVTASSLFSRDVEATLKIHDKVFARWDGKATFGFHINMTLTPSEKSPIWEWMRLYGIKGYSDTVHVIASPVTKSVSVEVTTPAFTIHNGWIQGGVGPSRIYITKQGQMYSGNASIENTDVTIDGLRIALGAASNQFAFLAPNFFQDSRLIWEAHDVELGREAPLKIGTLNVAQETIVGDMWHETQLYNQSIRWKVQNVKQVACSDAQEGILPEQGSFALADGDVILQNVPLANWRLLERIYDAVKTRHISGPVKHLFEDAGMAVVVDESQLQTQGNTSTWSGVLRYAPVKGGPAQWGFGQAQINLQSFTGFDSVRHRLERLAKKHTFEKTDTGYETSVSWDARGFHTPKHTFKVW